MLLISRILSLQKDRKARAERLTVEQAQFAEAQERKLTYQRVFNSPDGEWVLADLAEYFKVTFASVAWDAKMNVDIPATFFQEGRREVIMFILRFVESPMRDIKDFRAPEELDPLED